MTPMQHDSDATPQQSWHGCETGFQTMQTSTGLHHRHPPDTAQQRPLLSSVSRAWLWGPAQPEEGGHGTERAQ